MSTCREKPRLKAPAKLNLGLRVVGRRSDGYHLLESVFWPIQLCDELELDPAAKLDLKARWAEDAVRPAPELPLGRTNLIYRALEIAEKAGAGAWKASLIKRIPMGAGLGGGSSDAGTVLRHFGKLVPELAKDLEDAAIALGADVPFFLEPRPTWVTGVGETLERKEIDATLRAVIRFNILVLPDGLETKLVFDEYKRLAAPFSTSRPAPFGDRLDILSFRRFLDGAANDLELAASRRLPLLARALSEMRKLPSLYAGMTGSGSTCFAVVEGEEPAKKNAKALGDFCRETGCRNFITETYALS